MCLDQGDAGEARTHNFTVLSQALYHWATVLYIYMDLYSNIVLYFDL